MEYIGWLRKLSDRLRAILVNIKNGNDLGESDIKILRALFPLWYDDNLTYDDMTVVVGRRYNTLISEVNDMLSDDEGLKDEGTEVDKPDGDVKP